MLHNIPRSVNWWYVFGSAVLTAFMIQVVTGMFLIMTYVPSPDHAYDSLNYISHHQLLGNVLAGHSLLGRVGDGHADLRAYDRALPDGLV